MPASDSDANEIIKRERARVSFLRALLDIHENGYARKPVNGNPLQLLRDEVWKKWHEEMHSSRPSQRRDYLDFGARQDEKAAAVTAILHKWATDC
jgi:hypothetical protein